MYKTTITLPTTDPYKAHQAVSNLVSKYLFTQVNNTVTILSEELPDAEDIREFRPETKGIQTFLMKVNATKKLRESGIVVKIPEENLQEYLEKKFNESGMVLKTLQIIEEGSNTFTQTRTGNKITKQFYKVIGSYEVINEELFLSKYIKGIGKGQCFGYGMVNNI
jgi:hypothetical protein